MRLSRLLSALRLDLTLTLRNNEADFITVDLLEN